MLLMQVATANHIREAGEKLFLQLLTLTAPTLDAARVITLEQRTLSLTLHIKCQQLPPTSSAAQQHSYRVFLQIQEWNEHNLDPVLWGWKRKNGQYIPVPTMKAAAPNELLQTIHCSCAKSGCNASCSCRKANLPCGAACLKCQHNCTNQWLCCQYSYIVHETLKMRLTYCMSRWNIIRYW